MEHGENDAIATAQAVALPVVVNGRIERAADRDFFQFTGEAGQTVVLEAQARRLESPLDAVITLLDAQGNVLAANDDREDLLAGANTHHADSLLQVTLPAAETYFVQITDTARQGGEAYGYRLRISKPRPDFELRVVPSSVTVPVNGTAAVTVYVSRADGFTGPIKLALENPAARITAAPVTLAAKQTSARLTLRGGGVRTETPVALTVVGTARIGTKDIVRQAVAAEDRMQAFLWRHLVPAGELLALTWDAKYQAPARRPVPPPPVIASMTEIVRAIAPPPKEISMSGGPTSSAASTPALAAGTAVSAAPAASAANAAAATPPKPKFTKQQIAGRLRQLKLLYEEGLLTDNFYFEKVAECDTSGQ
jgi:hypothetical protein